MRPVPHVPRVSCCTLLRQNPGNCTENPPSSRPCRGWPDCLAVDAGRSEPVSSPRCGYYPSSAVRPENSREFVGVGSPRGTLADFAPGVRRRVLGGRLSQTRDWAERKIGLILTLNCRWTGTIRPGPTEVARVRSRQGDRSASRGAAGDRRAFRSRHAGRFPGCGGSERSKGPLRGSGVRFRGKDFGLRAVLTSPWPRTIRMRFAIRGRAKALRL